MARANSKVFMALIAAAATALGSAEEGPVSQELAGSTVETLQEEAVVVEGLMGEALTVKTVEQRGFLASRHAGGEGANEDAEAAGEAATEANATELESAPARRLCLPVGYPCFINAQCCAARCVSTHVCAPKIR